MYFGDIILYLSVNSNIHREVIRQISQSNDLIKKFFELDDLVPHLTLGKEQYGGKFLLE